MRSADNVKSTVYKLGIEDELRFVIGDEETVSIELLSGFAEIFGSELVQNTVYTFLRYTSISVFSWKGCTVKLSGEVLQAHVKSDSLIMINVCIHACLEEQRIIAESNSRKGPACLVVGSALSGKSTFCRFLLNYAVRMGRNPLYIDLDLSQNRSLVPGTLSIFPVKKPSHITEGFSKEDLSVYPFGQNHPRGNSKLYFLLIKKLGKMVQERLNNANPNLYNSGVIIDTSSWNNKRGYGATILTIRVFKIDVVFVINCIRMFTKLKAHMPTGVEVVFVPKQKGIVNHNDVPQKKVQENLIWKYFYGSIQNPLTPYEFEVNFSDFNIYSAASRADCNATVADMCNVSNKDVEIISVTIGPKLVNSILGLSYADKLDDNILVTNVKGFICVIDVNMKKKAITVLSPQPAPLPSKIMILSSMKFFKK